MSSRKSRFKVIANIPTRRKHNAEEAPKDITKANEEAEKNTDFNEVKNIKVEEPELTKDDKAVENAALAINITEKALTPVTPPTIPEKTIFKRVRPAVCLPLKKQKPRLVEFTETVNDAPVSQEILKTSADENVVSKNTATLEDSGKENACPTLEVQTVEEPITKEGRPDTPVFVAIPTSPLKSPARTRFSHPSVVENSIRRIGAHVSSASESEDEPRLATSTTAHSPRVRKASETVVNIPKCPPLAPVLPPPDADTDFCRLTMLSKRKKPKTSQFVRKIAEARRDFFKKFENRKPDRSSLKMFDLIFYNPTSNPITSTTSGSPRSRSDRKSVSSEREKEVEEENMDDPGNEEDPAEKSDCDDELKMPVPQVKIGANGEIILDEKSLVIETTEARKGREALLNSVPVFEDMNRKVSYYGKKTARVKDWTPVETKLFYKALNSLGTDFALMQELFPNRARAELKNKFKREERQNLALIDTALSQPSSFNIKTLRESFERERKMVEEETKRQLEEKQRLTKERKEMRLIKREQILPLASHPFHHLKQFSEVNIPTEPNMGRKRPKRLLRRKIYDDFVDPCEINDDGEIRKARKITRSATVYSPVRDLEEPTTVMSSDSEEEPLERTESISNEEFIKLLNEKLQNLHQSTIKLQFPANGEKVRVILEDAPVDNGDIEESPTLFSTETIGPTAVGQGREIASPLTDLCRQIEVEKRANSLMADPQNTGITESTPHVVRPSVIKMNVRERVGQFEKESTSEISNISSQTCLKANIAVGYTEEVVTSQYRYSENEIKPVLTTHHNTRTKASFEKGNLNSMPMKTDAIALTESQHFSEMGMRSYAEQPNAMTEHDYYTVSSTTWARNESGVISSAESNNLLLPLNSKIVYTFQPDENIEGTGTQAMESNEFNEEKIDEKVSPVEPFNQNETTGRRDLDVVESHDGYYYSDSWDRSSDREQVEEDCDISESNYLELPEKKTVAQPRVEYRSVGDFQYVVINGPAADNRMFLTNLRKGSFVFMTTENSQLSSAQHCRMYMIDEVKNAEGMKELIPMPVRMPPDLMEIINREISG